METNNAVREADMALLGADRLNKEYLRFVVRVLQGIGWASINVLANVLNEAMGLIKPESTEFMHFMAMQFARIITGSFNRELCNAVMAKWPSPTCELVSLKLINGKWHVLLLQRPPNVDHPNQYHFGGGIWWVGEHTYDQPLNRIAKREYPGLTFTYEPIGYFPAKDDRGTIVCCINLVKWNEDVPMELGQWYDVDDLPKPMVEHHQKIIRIALMWVKKELELQELRKKVIELEAALLACQQKTVEVGRE